MNLANVSLVKEEVNSKRLQFTPWGIYRDGFTDGEKSNNH